MTSSHADSEPLPTVLALRAGSPRASAISTSQVPPEAERSAVVVFSEPVCAFCGRPRSPRKRETCSDRCRVALSRRRRAGILRDGLLALRAQVDDLLAWVEATRRAKQTP